MHKKNTLRVVSNDTSVKGAFHIFSSITGGFFLITGLFTLFNMVSGFGGLSVVHGGGVNTFIFKLTPIFSAGLSFFIYYGLTKRKRWILPVTAISFIFVSFMYILQAINFSILSSIAIMPSAVFGTLFTVLLLNRDKLSGILMDRKIIISFTMIFLVVVGFFLMKNFN